MNTCSKCKIDTPLSMMVQNGKGYWCKECSKDYSRRFRGTPRGKAYIIYNGMLTRCYDTKSSRFNKYGGAGITVDKGWLGEDGFNIFFEWYKKQKNNDNKNYQLDKDIICNKNNIKPHIYSPNTCMFISRSKNQRNYSTLLINNTSGYTGVGLNKNGITWNFRLHREHNSNISRSGFISALEAAKSRESCIVANSLDFKLEHVGSSILLTDKIDGYTYYGSSNYNNISLVKNKYTGVIRLFNGKRKSIGLHLTERTAAETRNNMILSNNVSELNTKSYLFGFDKIIKV